MIDLRKLFDRYKVQWRDRGANCSKGRINIPCPFCINDPSYHMSISEEGLGFYCFRNPDHAGRNLATLFSKLKIPHKEYANENVTKVERVEQADTNNYATWNYFSSASTNLEAINYLATRNFSNPREIAKQFNLKVDTTGRWAGRLLVPLSIGWTGRAMRPGMEPRYLAHTNQDGYFYYSCNSSTAIIMEGFIDCAKIVSVTSQFDVYGKCGNRLNAAFLFHLRSKGYRTIINSPDTDVAFVQYEKETRLLRSYASQSTVKLFRLPNGTKDWGVTTESEARQLVRSL